MKLIYNSDESFNIFDIEELSDKLNLTKKIAMFIKTIKTCHNKDIKGMYQVEIYPSKIGTYYIFNKLSSLYGDEIEIRINVYKNGIIYEYDDYFCITNKDKIYKYNGKYYAYDIDLLDVEYVNTIYGPKKENIEQNMALLKQ